MPQATDASIADLLNAAYEPLRALPRLVPQPVETAVVAADDIRRQREAGWFGDACLTAMREDQLAALMDLHTVGTDAQIGAFATHPAYQRQGLASALLAQGLDRAREAGCQSIRTASFVDSRNAAACALLEQHGFAVLDPDRQNMVMQIDMDGYVPQAVALPEGYELRSLRMDRLDEWIAVKDAVFGGTTPPEWFTNTFSHRPDFDPTGWLMIYHETTPIGIAGADFHRDPARPEVISGCQIEYVGVLDNHRGKRLGELIMRACLNNTREHSVKPCQLITQEFRTAAVTLYEKLGFRRVRENRIYQLSLNL